MSNIFFQNFCSILSRCSFLHFLCLGNMGLMMLAHIMSNGRMIGGDLIGKAVNGNYCDLVSGSSPVGVLLGLRETT